MLRTLRAVVAMAATVTLLVLASGCHVLRDGRDITFGPYWDHDSNPSTPTVPFSAEIEFIDDGAGARDGVEHIAADTIENCVDPFNEDSDPETVGSVGDVGSATIELVSGHVVITDYGTPPSEDTVNCMLAEIGDDPNVNNDNESLVCDDGTSDADCQVPDGGGMGTYVVDTERTDWYQGAFDTYAEVEALITLTRGDYLIDDNWPGDPGHANVECRPANVRCFVDPSGGSILRATHCLAVRVDSAWTTGNDNRTVQLRSICLS